MADCADYVITIFFLYILIETIRNSDEMQCATPIPLYEIGNISIILLLFILNLSNDAPIQNACFTWMKILTYVLLVPFFFVWTLLGTIWVIQNIILKNDCLNTTQIVFLFIGQSIIYFCYFFLSCVFFAVVRKFYLKSKKQEDGKKGLLLFYKNKEIAKNLDVDKFLTDYTVLESTGVLDTEKELFLKHCKISKNDLKDDDSCVICLDSLKEKGECLKVGCTHHFHASCILDWYKVKPRCPMCKRYFRDYLMKKYKEGVLHEEGEERIDKV